MTPNWLGRMLVAATALALFTPAHVFAQQAAGISGVVRDESGGVLPGVTVEAASPVLIEKVRTAVSDGEGRYSITDLRPGSYTVTFSLSGFNTFKRDGITLTAGFTASVNADMVVGALSETITVSGAAPLVDTQNVKQQNVISADLLAALPSGSKGHMDLIRLIPGMSSDRAQGGGGAAGIYASNATHGATMHGKAGAKVSYDGMQVNNLAGTGAVSYIMNPSTVVETTVEKGGISAESNASGVSFNMIPKEGGNTFTYGADFTFSNEDLQGENLSDDLRARGVTATTKILRAYDTNITVGGPLRRDRLWFFAATRFTGTKSSLPGVYVNATQGTPFYTADVSRPAFSKDWLRSQAIRLTWQLSEKNKINLFADPQTYQTRGQNTANAPEANVCWNMWPQGLFQGTWSSTRTSRLLMEAGASLTKNPFPCSREDVTQTYGFTVRETDVSILEQSTGFRYNAFLPYLYTNDMDRYHERFSVSYVTGTHAFKFGFETQQHRAARETVVNGDVSYTFVNQVPTTITQWATPYLEVTKTKADLALYAQDRWAFKRLTVNYGLRFDYYNSYVPPQRVAATQFVAAREYPAVEGVPEWTDVNPRLGVSYDLFGTGRTAIKGSLGRYVGKHGIDIALANSPITTSVNSVNRGWADANGNYVPDCDLTNFGANGECGPIANVNFGRSNPNAVRWADDMVRGFGKRDYFWDLSAELQHELRQGASVTAGYYRNWSDHFPSYPAATTSGVAGHVDNLAIGPEDFEEYCITAPMDSRLPGGGGYPVCGLYDIVPGKFGVGDLMTVRASNFGGKSLVQDFFTFGLNVNVGGAILAGSLDTGRSVEDNCFVIDSPQQRLYCRIVRPFASQTQLKLSGSYPLPGGFIASAVFQNLSGISYNAAYNATTAEVSRSLGRPLAGGTRAVSVPLVAPFTQFEPRRSLLDIRLSKVFDIGGRARLRANLDLYNALNDASILEINSNYGPRWLEGQGRGGGVIVSRLVQLGGQFTF